MFALGMIKNILIFVCKMDLCRNTLSVPAEEYRKIAIQSPSLIRRFHATMISLKCSTMVQIQNVVKVKKKITTKFSLGLKQH